MVKSISGMRTFATATTLLLALQIIFSLVYVIAIYAEPRIDFIQQCEGGLTDPNTVNTCTNKIQEVKGITVFIVCVSLLVHACEDYLCQNFYYFYSFIHHVDEVYFVRAFAEELERTYGYHDLLLGTKYLTGERSSRVYQTEGSKLRAGLYNALLATAFFRCWSVYHHWCRASIQSVSSGRYLCSMAHGLQLSP